MPGRLDGTVCVITGTGGSMGCATGLAFARQGASVVCCDVSIEPAESTVEMVRDAGAERSPCNRAISTTRPTAKRHETGSRTRSVRAPCSARRCWVASAGPRKSRTSRWFRASDQSSYVTGADIVVDGGMKVW